MRWRDYEKMNVSKLLDLLALETEKFTHLLAQKQFSEEYEETKRIIHEITAILEKRRNGQNISDPLSAS